MLTHCPPTSRTKAHLVPEFTLSFLGTHTTITEKENATESDLISPSSRFGLGSTWVILPLPVVILPY